MSFARPSGRAPDQLRDIVLETNVTRYAEGSCLAKFGHTHVLCTASWTDKVPGWMRGSGSGWVTGEYGMLPRATHTRGNREAARGKQSGRTQEIQRLIGRSLRSVVDLKALGENQITIDCDVLQADGGTRTAAISGAWVALSDALTWMDEKRLIRKWPLKSSLGAVSVGVVKGEPMLDLCYVEDSKADSDVNLVMTGEGEFVEVQGAAEGAPFSRAEFDRLLELGEKGCREIFALQEAALKG